VYITGEARTGANGVLDLHSRTAAFRLQSNAALQLQDVNNAVQRLVLKAGRLFISHDPQGRDMIVVQAGKKRVEALDTTFSVVVTDTASDDDNVKIAVPNGGGSLKITLDSGQEYELEDGKDIDIPADADVFPEAQTLDAEEESDWTEELTAWEDTPDVDVPAAPHPIAATGQTISTEFADYWEENDGVDRVGYPIGDSFDEPQIQAQADDGVTAQCFERSLLEFHPAYRGTDYAVLSALLGDFGYRRRYGDQGAPGQVPNQTPGQSRYFPETGHWVGGKFRQYWQTTGGLAVHGYPISEEFVEASPLDPGRRYRVQYFERSLFEYHPEFAGTPYEVSLAQLGRYYCQAWGAPVPESAVVEPLPPDEETPIDEPPDDETPLPDETPEATETPGALPAP